MTVDVAVTAPSGSTARRPASDSLVVEGRLPSSRSSMTSCSDVSPVSLSTTSLVVRSGTISSANRPASCAAAVRCWEISASSSCRSRLTPYRSATISAVCSIGM
ncbi:Uncharacterised protein [Mycobacteroides abscessus subsp. abscessus]|nr:Uncharacterised protein [Mycobacteroides abscessus subsp. abscessus]